MNNQFAKLTAHAETRTRQRGSKTSTVVVLQHVADRCIHLGDGACVISITHRKAEHLRQAGFSSSFIERLEKLSLVINEFDGAVITILKGALSSSYRPRGHHHRRGGRREYMWA